MFEQKIVFNAQTYLNTKITIKWAFFSPTPMLKRD